MRVDAQIVDLLRAPVENKARHALRRAVGGDAVDGAVGARGVPCTVDDCVARISAEDKREYRRDPALPLTDMQRAGRDVRADDVLAGVAAAPLRRVSVFRHEGARVRIYLRNARNVALLCPSDVHRLSVPSFFMAIPHNWTRAICE